MKILLRIIGKKTKEQEIDNEFIEKEDEIYMRRLTEERERRHQDKDEDSVLL
ncbi:sporulation YhaL family protein [Bacillus sp. CGMCC 1.60114]|uniref:sporulation YhaL family protein n=1 Tax=unclassified Bacillus (in: firmicutes) TaxID=185979 RepID=UPI003630C499